jgi:hypothetical protein
MGDCCALSGGGKDDIQVILQPGLAPELAESVFRSMQLSDRVEYIQVSADWKWTGEHGGCEFGYG